jgi:hypothetical protein
MTAAVFGHLADQRKVCLYALHIKTEDSGNHLSHAIKGKNGIFYQRRNGLCLKAQAHPDFPDKPQFPHTMLRPRRVYHQFSTR